jgi:hypothetical protein
MSFCAWNLEAVGACWLHFEGLGKERGRWVWIGLYGVLGFLAGFILYVVFKVGW